MFVDVKLIFLVYFLGIEHKIKCILKKKYSYIHITSNCTSILLDFVEYDSCTDTHLKIRPWFSLDIVNSKTDIAIQVLGLSNSVVLVCRLVGRISC